MEIPPLGMVDDLLCISECGYQTAMMNSYINYKTNSKKLQFGATKCKKIHVGKICEEFKCQKVSVDNWVEVSIGDKIEDVFNGEVDMEDTESERYLGDIISNNGRNMNNFKARVNKGIGIVNNIFTYLEAIPFGKHYFEVGIMLRNSLLVSSVLCNSEAWYNVTEAEYNFIETVELMFMRRILNTPKTTPKEMLYLELGCLQFRHIIQKRRLSFLHYLLNEESDSMVNKFLWAQMEKRNPKEWTTTILKDIEELNLKLTLEEIKNMKLSTFSNILKNAIDEKALKDLNKTKSKHSKVLDLKHTSVQMKKYLKPNPIQITREEMQCIFKLRSRMTEVKMNYQGLYDDFECEACGEEQEDQEHVYHCKVLLKMNLNKEENPQYAKIFNGKVIDQLKIAKTFIQNMSNKETLMKNENS